MRSKEEPKYGSKAWFLMTPDEIAKFRKEHDEIPVRTRGRPMRAVKIKECLKVEVARDGWLKCRECPKYQLKGRYCPILAQFRNGDVAACKYGKLLIAQDNSSKSKVEGEQMRCHE